MDEYREMRKVYYAQKQLSSAVLPILQARLDSDSTLQPGVKIGDNGAFIVQCREIVTLIEEIYRLDKQVTLTSNRLPREAARQYIRNAIIEEIHQTNEVENVHSTRREIRQSMEEIQQGKPGKRFDGMIRKYNLLLEQQSIPLFSCQDVRALYDGFILDEVLKENPNNMPDGIFFRKESALVIDARDRMIHKGVFPEHQVITDMEKALGFVNDASVSLLIRCAAFHHLFGYIHPFYDGNGRMARFISSYLLSRDLNLLICLRLSYVIKSNRTFYYKMFRETNDRHNYGDTTQFVIRFLSFVRDAAQQVLEYLSGTADRLTHFADILKRSGLGEDRQTLLFFLIQATLCGDEGIPVQGLMELMSNSRSTVLKLIRELGDTVGLRKAGKKHLYHADLDAVENLSEQNGAQSP